MIIKGGSRANGRFFANHLTNDRGEERSNDRAELCEMRGVTAETVDGFFREIEAVASGTRCQNYFYQASINPALGETLTPEQWTKAVDRLEKNLGFEGLPRFVIEHEKHDRVHRHVVWSRIDPETLRARDDSLTYPKHARTSRELEREFGLRIGRGPFEPDREGPRPERRQQDWEGFRHSQTKSIDPQAIKAELSELWQHSDNGKAFKAALEERGYILAQGDRRDFCILDHAGDVHSLARRLDGVKAADVREHTADIDRSQLPTVEQARGMQRALFTRDGVFDREAAVTSWLQRDVAVEWTRGSAERPIQGDTAVLREAWALATDGASFAELVKDSGNMLAKVTPEEARESERLAAFAEAVGRRSPALREGDVLVVNSFGRAVPLTPHNTGSIESEIKARLDEIDRSTLPSVETAKQAMREKSREAFHDKVQRGREMTPLEKVIDGALRADPTQNSFAERLDRGGIVIARATADDMKMLHAEHRERMEKRGPDEQRAPSKIAREGDLYAVTRSGKAFRLNPTKLDANTIEQRLTKDERPIGSIGEARETQAQNAAMRLEERTERQAEARQTWEKESRKPAPEARGPASKGSFTRGPIKVVDRTAKVVGGLLDIVASLLFMGGATKRTDPFDFDPQKDAANRERSNEAIANMRESMDRGQGVNVEDLRSLSHHHLVNLSAKGDDYLRALIEQQGRERERDDRYSGSQSSEPGIAIIGGSCPRSLQRI